MISEKEKQAYVNLIKKYPVARESEHNLAHGMPSSHFFDIDGALFSKEPIDRTIDLYVKLVNESIDEHPNINQLVFLEKEYGTIGMLPAMTQLVSATGFQASVVRLSKELSVGLIKGEKINKNTHALIISDVLTAGEGITKTTKVIEKFGGKVECAIVLYNRGQDGEKILKLHGIQVKYVYPNPGELAKYGLYKKAYRETRLPKELINGKIPPSRRIDQPLKERMGKTGFDFATNLKLIFNK